jgi:sugar diacid utilization regulator
MPPRLEQRARHAGLDLSSGRRVLLLDSDARELLAAARADRGAMSCVVDGRIVVAAGAEPAAELARLHRTACSLGLALHVGVSSVVTDIACGVRQADVALRVAMCSVRSGTVCHDDLGSLRVLLSAPNQDALLSLVKSRIGPLAERDRERPMELVETLRVYLHAGGNRRRAAERCHVHQSTIKYRLHRIAEVLGCDLADADVRFDLMLALKVLELLRSVDADPTTGRALQAAA